MNQTTNNTELAEYAALMDRFIRQTGEQINAHKNDTEQKIEIFREETRSLREETNTQIKEMAESIKTMAESVDFLVKDQIRKDEQRHHTQTQIESIQSETHEIRAEFKDFERETRSDLKEMSKLVTENTAKVKNVAAIASGFMTLIVGIASTVITMTIKK